MCYALFNMYISHKGKKERMFISRLSFFKEVLNKILYEKIAAVAYYLLQYLIGLSQLQTLQRKQKTIF